MFAILVIHMFLSTVDADVNNAQCPCHLYMKNNGIQTADCRQEGLNPLLTTIPDCVPNTTQVLDFTHNNLEYSSGQFQRFDKLTILFLNLNTNFVVHDDCFHSLFQLEVLSLAGTNLSLLTGAAFVDQTRLRRLFLGDDSGNLVVTKDLFTHLKMLSWLVLVSLQDIYISRWGLSGLPLLEGLSIGCQNLSWHKDSFVGLTNFTFMFLKSCHYTICMQEMVLQPMQNLEELWLLCDCDIIEPNCTNNLLQSVPSIKILRFDKRYVSHLGEGFLTLTKLEELYLVSGSPMQPCSLDALDRNVFANLKNTVLRILSLEGCFIGTTHVGSFQMFRNLTTLNLDILTFYDFVFLMYFADGLEYTNIQTIRLSVKGRSLYTKILPPIYALNRTRVKVLELTNTDYKYILSEVITGLPKSLTSLNLTFNSFIYIDVWDLEYLENLEILDLSNQVKSHNYRSLLPSEKAGGNTENPALSFEQQLNHARKGLNLPYRLQRLYISKSQLLCQFVPTFYASNNSLRILDASEQYDWSCFDNDEFWNVLHNLAQLTNLNLNSNEISTIPSGSFVGLQKLRTLSLVKNKLTELSFDVSGLVSLDIMNLSFNSIRYASELFISQIDKVSENQNVTIHLINNPLDCHCNHRDFVAWLQYTKIISNKKHLNCTFENGTKIGLEKISRVHYLLDSQCIMVEVTVGCVVTFSLLSLILGGIAYIWHNRQQLEYLLAFGRRTLNPYHPVENCEVQMEYDVYISYEGEYYVTPDMTLRDFVIKIILPGLERLGVRTLIREELQAGRNLYEVISKAVRRSKKVLALLSKDYCKDMWNVFEFNQGVMEGIYTNRQVAIPVLFESLRREHVNEEIYAFLQMEPLYKYTSELSNKAFIEFLYERISDTRKFS